MTGVRAIGYAYPWDFVGDPAAVDRVRALRLDAVAVAANYHAVRVGTPWHPRHRVVDAEHAACYVPVRPAKWRGRRLVPATPGWVGEDSFGAARDALRATGTDVLAWVVLTHNSALGRDNQDLVMRDAFGTPHRHALCPANEEVADYCATLVAEIVPLGDPDGLVLEACGQFGIVHDGHHDKTGLAGWTTLQRQLLSICHCSGCQRRYRTAGLDPVKLAERVRAAVSPNALPDTDTDTDTDIDTDTATDIETGTDIDTDPMFDAVAVIRADIARQLRRRLVEEAPGLPVAVHASADPWAAGSFATIAGGIGAPVNTLVARCWDDVDSGAASLAALRSHAPDSTAIGAYLLADHTWERPDKPVAPTIRRYLVAGMNELHLYHLGLVGEAGHRLMADLIESANEV